MVRENDVAFHAPGVNRDSIGIEHADICNEPAPFTVELYESSAALLRDLSSRFGFDLNRDTVKGHEEAAGDHDDPGAYWDFDYYFLLLAWDGVTADTRPQRLVSSAADQSDVPAGWQVASRRHIDDGRCARRGDPYGAQYWHVDLADVAESNEFEPASFRFDVSQPGLYKISLWWPRPSASSAAADAPVTISLSGDLESSIQQVTVKQGSNAGIWNDIGDPVNITFPPAVVTVRLGAGDLPQSGVILADSVRLLRTG